MNAIESLKIVESFKAGGYTCDYLNPKTRKCAGCILFGWPDRKTKCCHVIRNTSPITINPEAIEYIKILVRKEKLEKLLSQP